MKMIVCINQTAYGLKHITFDWLTHFKQESSFYLSEILIFLLKK